MRNQPFRALASLCACLLASSAASQSVLVVDDDGGPGVDFSDFGTALNAAQPRDTLLMRPGVYTSPTINLYTLNIPLRIIGDGTGEVRIEETLRVTGLGPNDQFTIRGVTFNDPVLLASTCGLQLIDNAGEAWVEDCVLSAAGLSASIPGGSVIGLEVRNSTVHVSRCTLIGNASGLTPIPGAGLLAENATVYLHDSTLQGGRINALDGAAGLHVEGNSNVFASGSSMTGGTGADGKLFFCAGNGGSGVLLASGSPQVELLDIEAFGAAAGTDTGCGTAVDGVPISVLAGAVSQQPGVARHYSATSVVPTGAPAISSLQGEPGDQVFLVLSAVYDPLELPAAIGPLLVGGAQAILPLGTLPPSGEFSITFTGPPLGGLPYLAVYLQAAFLDGADVYLGPASAQTLLP